MTETTSDLIEFRCPECGRLICKVAPLQEQEVEARCPRQGCRKLVRAKLEASPVRGDER